MKWGIRSMVWYIFVLVIAFFVSFYYYTQFINDPTIKRLLFS